MADERPDSGGQTARRIRLPLKVKLSFLITTLLVAAVALVSGFLLRQQQQNLTSQMTKRGLTIAKDLANSTKNTILSNDEPTLNLLVQEATKDQDIVYLVF